VVKPVSGGGRWNQFVLSVKKKNEIYYLVVGEESVIWLLKTSVQSIRRINIHPVFGSGRGVSLLGPGVIVKQCRRSIVGPGASVGVCKYCNKSDIRE
jgi:hypothetical protein